jgi:hypothetical protein
MLSRLSIMTREGRVILHLPLLIWFACSAGTATLVLERWLAPPLIYQTEREPQRAQLREAILQNELPAGVERWRDLGAQGSEIRIGTIYLMEAVQRSTGLSATAAQRLIAVVSLFLSLLLLPIFLLRWFDPAAATVGQLWFILLQPLAYQFHYFHPWDRPSLLMWMVGLFLVRDRRPVLTAMWILLAIPVKYDIAALPGLYLLAFTRKSNVLRPAVEALFLFMVAFAGYWLLVRTFGYSEQRPLMELAETNLRHLSQWTLYHPIILANGVLFLGGVLGWRHRGEDRGPDRFMLASFIFGLGLLAVFFVQTNFHEYRAQTMVTVLLLPLALWSLNDYCLGFTAPARSSPKWIESG